MIEARKGNDVDAILQVILNFPYSNYGIDDLPIYDIHVDGPSDLVCDLVFAIHKALGSDGIDSPHIVEITKTSWFIEHPLSCRMGGKQLADCLVHDQITENESESPSHEPGRYRVFLVEDGNLEYEEEIDGTEEE